MPKGTQLPPGLEPGKVMVQGGDENESTPREQRHPSTPAPVVEGPRRGKKDCYLPATYPVAPGITRTDR